MPARPSPSIVEVNKGQSNMRTKPFPARLAIVTMAVLCSSAGVAHSEQQASFAVAITLHAISKPVAVERLCPDGKPLDRTGVLISVTCPATSATGFPAFDDRLNPLSRGTRESPVVVVTF